jgi:hypothetical protein
MKFNNLCLIVVLIFVVFIFSFNCIDLFKSENYTPSVIRPLPCTKDQNTCKFPCTNNTLDTTSNKDVYIYQYANRMILNPEQYLILVKKLLNDLSTKKIDVSKINDKNLKEIEYSGDREPITKFIDSEINKLISTKKYLQNNGTWKYEYFSASDPTIYFFEVSNGINGTPKVFQNLPDKFSLFKIMYTLANPLRSSYTRCLAFITVVNGKFNIEFTGLVNDFERTVQDNLKVIPTEALNFSFIDTIANNDFDQFGNTGDYSGLNYISEPRDSPKINVKADIPKEFKPENFQPQHLPPLFGNGLCKYPPMYKIQNDKSDKKYYFNTPPLYS